VLNLLNNIIFQTTYEQYDFALVSANLSIGLTILGLK
jgi:hypothetical protein